MIETQFDRDEMAREYADRHLNIDPGTRNIYYLKSNAPNEKSASWKSTIDRRT